MEAQGAPRVPIIYQDHHLLVVNKPAGLVIHPTYKHADGTMWDAVLAALAEQGERGGQGSDDWQPVELPDKPGWERAPAPVREMLREQQRLKYLREEGLLPRPCLLHRLDRDTSGVVALARTERACRHLSRQFQQHSAVKRYLAVVGKGAPGWASQRLPLEVSGRIPGGRAGDVPAHGWWTVGGEMTIEAALQRDPEDRRRCIVGPQGQYAVTIVKTLAATERHALLEVRPVTGRTHQIRAHLAAVGCAIVGDKTYGPDALEDSPAGPPRQFLHAYSLELRRYPDDMLCTFSAPLAADLVAWLAKHFPEGMEVIRARNGVPAG